MSLKNSSQNYGSIAKWLHWSIALLFLGSYLSVYYRQLFTESQTTENAIALQLHISIGISIGTLAFLRILWRISNDQLDPEPGSKFEHLAARVGHYCLYVIMIAAPLTGYLGTGVTTDFFFLFEIPSFRDTQLFASTIGHSMTFEEFEGPIDIIHKNVLGEWLIWLLILGHASAAMYHHLLKKDRTFLRMTSGK